MVFPQVINYKERDGRKEYSVVITVNNAQGDCNISKTYHNPNTDQDEVTNSSGNVKAMGLNLEVHPIEGLQ